MYQDDSDKKGLLTRGLKEGLASRSARDVAAGGINLLGTSALLGKRKVVNLYFLDKKIVLDGYSFEGCRFDRCTLVVATTNFDITNCIIDASCTIEYGSHVTKLIQLFNGAHPKAYEFFAPPFVPLRNPDGTITIVGG